MKRFAFILLCLCCCLGARAEVIPPAPKLYFNDYAGVASADTASRLNKTLEDFERQTSSQILVAVFQKMESDSSIEDYTVRVAQSWKVGQKSKDNGAVLFVFIQNRTMFIQVGYGLEGALPDALCKRIIEEEIKPHFRNSDFDGGLSAGVTAMLAAAKGEYKGTGSTASDHIRMPGSESGVWIVAALIVFAIIFSSVIRGARPSVYSRRGRSSGSWSVWGGGGGWSGGGGGGGFSGGGGGGFSGGGGSFGGGGAGGSW